MAIPNFSGTVSYDDYVKIEQRIQSFNNYSTVGLDESGQYTMYRIDIGDTSKPKILITAGVHGVEWQGVDYSLKAMKMIEDDTYPDQNLNQLLKENFHIVYMPCLNPHGYDTLDNIYAQFSNRNYWNSNSVDINRDFFNEERQQETNNTIQVMLNTRPFAHLDIHLFQPSYGLAEGNNLIVGIENQRLYHLRDKIASEMEMYTGENVTVWNKTNTNGKVRDFTTYQSNSSTPHTFSILSEIKRPATVSGSLRRDVSDANIYKYGNAFIHSFLTTAIEYYTENNTSDDSNQVSKIITPTSEINFVRDSQGRAIRIEEVKSDYTLVSTIKRDIHDNVTEIETERV